MAAVTQLGLPMKTSRGKTTRKAPAKSTRKKPQSRKSVLKKPATRKTTSRRTATKKTVKKPPAKKTVNRRRRPVNKRQTRPVSLMLTPAVLRGLGAVALSLVLFGAGMWIWLWINNPQNLSIQRVDWQSEFQYLNRDDLQTVIEPHVQTNLYLLDGVALEQELEAHPWIRAASLRNAWPDQLMVNIEEQLPIAFWGEDQLLNQFGEIFTADLPEKIGVFPVIYSPKDNGREMAERYLSLSESLRGLGLEIVELTENSKGIWRMKLRDGQEVIIGRKEQQKRIERFKVGYMQELRASFADVRTIDLRYTNGFAIEWKRGSKGAKAVSSLQSGDWPASQRLGS